MKNKVVVITGASRGIGRATALLFAQRGANVVANYHSNKEAADSLLKEMNGDHLIVQGDVSKAADIDKLLKATLDKFGRVDVLINNAGIINRAAWDSFTEAAFTECVNTNMLGPMYATQIFAPELKKTKGNIINVCSTYGIIGAAPVAVYTATKAALINFTKSTAVAMGPDVRVNAFLPGNIDTDMSAGAPKEFLDYVVQQTPLKRMGTANEMALCMAFLASDDARFVTGHEFIADGGHILMN